jgi:hypothetical protein
MGAKYREVNNSQKSSTLSLYIARKFSALTFQKFFLSDSATGHGPAGGGGVPYRGGSR